MKKFLVLTLVLGIASLATAGLTLTGADTPVAPGTVLSIGILSDGLTQSDGMYVTITGADYSYDVSMATNTVNEFMVLDFSGGLIFADLAIVAVPVPKIPLGQVVNGIAVTVNDLTMITLSNWTTGEIYDSATISIIPEPATMVLLGLGALVLRRKK